MKRYFLLLCLAAFAGFSFRPHLPVFDGLTPSFESETDYPQGYFTSPVAFPIKLTGTFGELRPDHFHSGIDIKSPNGKTGAPIFAVADGYVYRIKISSGGYGNALYVKHPNGYTSVYGHLESMRSDLAAYVKAQQYAKEEFEVNLYPSKNRFSVEKGKEIGKLGNSGSSSGPHLHFEIRHSGTDKALNPLLFNFPVPDQEPPSLRGMKAYTLDDEMQVLNETAFDLIKIAPGRYKLAKDTVKLGGWRAGFSVKAYDSMTGFVNDNGIYALTMSVNDQVVYHFRMEELDFDETRYLNAHIDYKAKKSGKGYYQRCFVQPGDKLNNYAPSPNRGVVPIYSEQATKVEIKAVDSHGNASDLVFYVLRDSDAPLPASAPYQYLFSWKQENRLELSDFKAVFPVGTLYQSLPMQFSTSPDISFGTYSSVFHIHDTYTPVHKYYNMSISAPIMDPDLQKKAFIAECSESKPVNCGGTWKDGWISTRLRRFGNFSVMTDTEPPTIVPLVFDANMTKRERMVFRIRDNYSTTGIARDLNYKATIDGKWILMEYDAKSDRIIHDFDDRTGPGEHFLRILVSDDRGNTNTFERTFTK